MHGKGAADEANRRGTGAKGPERIDARLHHGGFVRQPQIIVGGEHDDLAASLHVHARALRCLEIVELLVDLVGLEPLDLRFGILYERAVDGHRTSIAG